MSDHEAEARRAAEEIRRVVGYVMSAKAGCGGSDPHQCAFDGGECAWHIARRLRGFDLLAYAQRVREPLEAQIELLGHDTQAAEAEAASLRAQLAEAVEGKREAERRLQQMAADEREYHARTDPKLEAAELMAKYLRRLIYNACETATHRLCRLDPAECRCECHRSRPEATTPEPKR